MWPCAAWTIRKRIPTQRNAPQAHAQPVFAPTQYVPAYEYGVQAGRPENSFFFWSTFVTRLLTPRSRKSGYGLLLGCRSGCDRGPFEKNFFDKVRPHKPGKSSLSVLVHDRNRSGVVELVGREPWIIARVENGVTKFSPHRQ